MESKKINQLATEMSPAASDLTIIGDPITGVSKKITLEQISSLFSSSISFYSNYASFPATGSIDTLYCAKDTNKLYLWNGSAYVQTFPSQALLDTYQLRSEKGAVNGYASLDGSGKVPVSQLPSSIMEYKGMWNAATNIPTLANGTGDTGDVYICNVAGTVNFGAGAITFAVGDYVIYSGSIWQRSSGAVGTVTSVAVTESGDALTITGSPITTSGTINIGFAGTSAQYVAGDGSLVTFPTIAGEAQNLITEVYNETGATLTKGTVVYINGGHGNLPTVTKALATSDSTSAQTYGIVQTDITNNNKGYVVVAGRILNIDTQSYAAGTQLYLSSTTAGAWTTTKQYAPAHLVYVGIVTRSHPTQGVVEVKIQNGYELDELHNVSAQTPSNNDGIFYNSSNSLWEAKSIATALGYTPANDSLVVHLAGTETITGAKTFSNLVTISTASYLTSRLKLTNTATGGNIWSVSSGNANNSTNNGLFSIINETLGKNIFALSPTGNIIIGEDVGTANPAYNLQVIGTNTVIKATDISGNNSNVTLQASNSAAYLSAGYATTAIPLIFQTGNTTRLTLAATGEATFTGALNGTSAVFSSTLSATQITSNYAGKDGLIVSDTTTQAAGVGGSILFKGVYTNGGSPLSFGRISLEKQNSTNADYSFNLSFYTSPNGGSNPNITAALKLNYDNSATFSSSVKVGAGLNVTGYTNSSSGNYWEIGSDSSGYYMNALNRSSGNYNLPAYIDAQKLIINNGSGGNVGIGTSSPIAKLDINGDVRIRRATDTTQWIDIYAASGEGYIEGVNSASATYQALVFRSGNNTGSTERMRITSSGNVGIGTSSPSGVLEVVGDIRSKGAGATLYFQNQSSSNYFAFYGNLNILVYNQDVGNIASIAYNTGIYTPLSDINKKKDFEDSKIGLNAILGLKPTLYRMKSDNTEGNKELGFIAQEVKEFIPEAYVENNDFIGLNYNAITAALVKAIQELKAEVEELKNK